MKHKPVEVWNGRGNVEESLKNQNKVMVLEAFNTLFNRRDYAAAESFWSPDYIQHSATSSRAATGCSI
jgi:hypothetical protein